jgi:DnaD/phage-associated family protein
LKDAYYFSHDNNARNDLKIKAMMSKYGYEGYGIFWALVEMMHESGEGELPLEEYLYIALQQEFNGSSTDVKQYIDDCINVFKLFETDGENFWSNSLKRRMAIREKKREQARKAGKRSAEVRKQRASATGVEQELNDRSTESNKGKERKEKGKEIKESNVSHKKIIDSLRKNVRADIRKDEIDLVTSWLDDGIETDVVIWAIEQAATNKKRNVQYINGILRNLHSENVLTMEGVKEREKSHKKPEKEERFDFEKYKEEALRLVAKYDDAI